MAIQADPLTDDAVIGALVFNSEEQMISNAMVGRLGIGTVISTELLMGSASGTRSNFDF